MEQALKTAAVLALLLLPVACGEPVSSDPSEENDAGAQSADAAAPVDGASLDGALDLDVSAAPDSLPTADAGAHDDVSTAPDTSAADDASAAPDAGAGPRTGCIQGSFEVYYGNTHSHTSYSDGEQTPADAFVHARDVAGIDILAVTDHVEQLIGERWPNCLEQAAGADAPGVFVATCGYEYGSGYSLITSTGHNNVFFADELMPAIQLDFHDFYDSLVACETCVGQYNHPGDDGAQTWNDFEYFADVDEKMCLFELNGGGPVWELFFAALDAGWHLSPSYNQDNHGADWGSKNDRRSAFLLPELDSASLRAAMLERRSFVSMDKNASLTLMADGDCWMGSILSGYSSLIIDVEARDADSSDSFTQIAIHGPAGALLETHDCGGAQECSAQLTIPVSSPTYAVARAEQTDGDYLVSAPIWVEP